MAYVVGPGWYQSLDVISSSCMSVVMTFTIGMRGHGRIDNGHGWRRLFWC